MLEPAFVPFRRLLDTYKEISQLTNLVENSLRLTNGIERAMRVLNNTTVGAGEQYTDADIASAQEMEVAAASQVDRGLPIVYAALTVYAWGALHACARDCIIGLLESVPETRKVPEISRIRVPLVEFEQLAESERWQLVVSILERETSAEFKRGHGVIDALTRPFGFVAKLSERSRKDLLEMRAIRNIIVHNSSRVDRKFLEICNWTERSEGEYLAVARSDFARYMAACHESIAELATGVRDKYYPLGT